MTTLPSSVAAALFDCDGTLADTEELWIDVADAVRRELGIADTADLDALGAAIPIYAAALAQHCDREAADLDQLLTERFEQSLGGSLQPMPGAVELLTALAGKLPIAVVSNSPTFLVERILEHLNVRQFCDVVIGADDGEPKPAPHLYVAALAELGVAAHQSIAFEDSPTGAIAATSSGLFTVAVAPAAHAESHLAVDGLADPALLRWADEVVAGGADPESGSGSGPEGDAADSVRVLSWNLWCSGQNVRRSFEKTLGVLIELAPDVVCLQECGGGLAARLAGAIGWNVEDLGTGQAIISRYPLTLVETATPGYALCVRAELPADPSYIWSVHAEYRDYGPYLANSGAPVADVLAQRGERRRTAQLARVLSEQTRLDAQEVLPAIIAGDFNVPSHLDWEPPHRDRSFPWPVSRMMERLGYTDTFRDALPSALADPGETWSPIYDPAEEARDRIDFVYARGLSTVSSMMVGLAPGDKWSPDHENNAWPSDHGAVLSVLSGSPLQG